jgi:hypothetical protein
LPPKYYPKDVSNFIAETAQRRREEEGRKTEFRYHGWVIEDTEVTRFQRDFEKTSAASKKDARGKKSLREAEKLSAIQVSDPKLPVPSLRATNPVDAPFDHYMDKLYYKSKEGDPGPWAKNTSETGGPFNVPLGQGSLHANARLDVDPNQQGPIVETALSKLPRQTDTDALGYLLYLALERCNRDDDPPKYLPHMFDKLSLDAQAKVKKPPRVKTLLGDAEIEALSHQIETIRSEIDRATYRLLEQFFSTEILAADISAEIIRVGHHLYDYWPVDTGHMVTDELRDRTLEDKLRLLEESFSSFSSSNPSIACLQESVKSLVAKLLGADLEYNKEMLATIFHATSFRLSTNMKAITEHINDIISRHEKASLEVQVQQPSSWILQAIMLVDLKIKSPAEELRLQAIAMTSTSSSDNSSPLFINTRKKSGSVSYITFIGTISCHCMSFDGSRN